MINHPEISFTRMFISRPFIGHIFYDVTDWVINLAQKLVTQVRERAEEGGDSTESIIRLENHCDTPLDPMFRF